MRARGPFMLLFSTIRQNARGRFSKRRLSLWEVPSCREIEINSQEVAEEQEILGSDEILCEFPMRVLLWHLSCRNNLETSPLNTLMHTSSHNTSFAPSPASPQGRGRVPSRHVEGCASGDRLPS